MENKRKLFRGWRFLVALILFGGLVGVLVFWSEGGEGQKGEVLSYQEPDEALLPDDDEGGKPRGLLDPSSDAYVGVIEEENWGDGVTVHRDVATREIVRVEYSRCAEEYCTDADVQKLLLEAYRNGLEAADRGIENELPKAEDLIMETIVEIGEIMEVRGISLETITSEEIPEISSEALENVNEMEWDRFMDKLPTEEDYSAAIDVYILQEEPFLHAMEYLDKVEDEEPLSNLITDYEGMNSIRQKHFEEFDRRVKDNILSEKEYENLLKIVVGSAFGGEYVWGEDAIGDEEREVFFSSLESRTGLDYEGVGGDGEASYGSSSVDDGDSSSGGSDMGDEIIGEVGGLIEEEVKEVVVGELKEEVLGVVSEAVGAEITAGALGKVQVLKSVWDDPKKALSSGLPSGFSGGCCGGKCPNANASPAAVSSVGGGCGNAAASAAAKSGAAGDAATKSASKEAGAVTESEGGPEGPDGGEAGGGGGGGGKAYSTPGVPTKWLKAGSEKKGMVSNVCVHYPDQSFADSKKQVMDGGGGKDDKGSKKLTKFVKDCLDEALEKAGSDCISTNIDISFSEVMITILVQCTAVDVDKNTKSGFINNTPGGGLAGHSKKDFIGGGNYKLVPVK